MVRKHYGKWSKGRPANIGRLMMAHFQTEGSTNPVTRENGGRKLMTPKEIFWCGEGDLNPEAMPGICKLRGFSMSRLPEVPKYPGRGTYLVHGSS